LASPFSFPPWETFGIVWLRTCYDEGSDRAHEDLLGKVNIDLALEVEENVLDDATLYAYGDDWHRIFEVIPERLFMIYMMEISGALPSARERDSSIVRLQRELMSKGDWELDEASATEALHYAAIVNYLFIADKTALETGKPLIIFFDDCGRVVRQARIQPDLCEDTAGAWHDCHMSDMPEFNEAEIGSDYLKGGVCGPPFASARADPEK
jgi:hypothetical protein